MMSDAKTVEPRSASGLPSAAAVTSSMTGATPRSSVWALRWSVSRSRRAAPAKLAQNANRSEATAWRTGTPVAA